MPAGSDDIEQQLLELVHRRLGVEARPADALNALGVDSLRLAGFVTDLERHFDLDVDQDLFEVETLEELARYIREHRVR
jgi:acyl carrier protein